MDDLEAQADRQGLDVCVESVVNEWLPEWLEGGEYTWEENSTPPSFHRAAGTASTEKGERKAE